MRTRLRWPACWWPAARLDTCPGRAATALWLVLAVLAFCVITFPVSRGPAGTRSVTAYPLQDAALRQTAVHQPPASTSLIILAPGDTLWTLAIRYHTTVPALQDINGLGTATSIYAGAAFRIPASSLPVPEAGQTLTTDGAARAIGFAMAQLGKPYLWGGTGPDSYDCSGLIMRAWQAAGVQLPRVTYDQVNVGTRITRDQLQPGDLVFSDGDGHVQLYLGHDQVIQAPRPGETIDIVPLPPPGLVNAYIHINPPS